MSPSSWSAAIPAIAALYPSSTSPGIEKSVPELFEGREFANSLEKDMYPAVEQTPGGDLFCCGACGRAGCAAFE